MVSARQPGRKSVAKSLSEIANLVAGNLAGDGSVAVTGIAGLLEASASDLSFLTSPAYARHLGATRAAALLVPAALGPVAFERPVLTVADADAAIELLVGLFRPAPAPMPTGIDPAAVVHRGAEVDATAAVHAHAVVESGASVGPRTQLYPGVYVGRDARIGADCVLHPNVVVRDRVRLGDRVVVHAGAVLGADGFGYRPGPKGLVKLEHIGTVVIGDDVEIGACTTIDRARFGATVVGRGTKIDNLVQVAHNVRIGAHVVIAAQAGVSGSTEIGDLCQIGGQAAFVPHVRVGKGCRIAARAGISKDAPDGAVLYGYVAREHHAKKREEAAQRKLPELLERVRALEAEIDKLQRARPE